MANFNTHLIVASTASGLTATGLMGAGVAEPREVLLYFSAGTLGGLLPDLDSDNSILLIDGSLLFYSVIKFIDDNCSVKQRYCRILFTAHCSIKSCMN